MLSYCLKCRKNTESINSKVSKTNNGKTMISSNVQYVVLKQEESGILSNLGLKTPSSKIPLLGDILF